MRTLWTARGFAAVTAVPLAACLLAIPAGVASAEPGAPDIIGEIISGSAGTDGAAPVDEPAGSPLGLGSGSSGAGGAADGTGTGSALGLGLGGTGDGTGSALGPGADGVAAHSIPLGTGSAVGTAGIATGAALLGVGTGSALRAGAGTINAVARDLETLGGPATPAANPVADATLGETLGFESGSVLTACAGSAVVGVGAILLGLATGSVSGSGLLGPGFVPGSSGLVGPGSAGAGSVVVGSAVTGSAVLTCLLLLPIPTPSEPVTPLLIPRSAPIVPAQLPLPAAPEPAPAPPVPVVVPPPVYTPAEALEPIPAPEDWSALQMMTVIILTLIAAARVRVRGPRE